MNMDRFKSKDSGDAGKSEWIDFGSASVLRDAKKSGKKGEDVERGSQDDLDRYIKSPEYSSKEYEKASEFFAKLALDLSIAEQRGVVTEELLSKIYEGLRVAGKFFKRDREAIKKDGIDSGSVSDRRWEMVDEFLTSHGLDRIYEIDGIVINLLDDSYMNKTVVKKDPDKDKISESQWAVLRWDVKDSLFNFKEGAMEWRRGEDGWNTADVKDETVDDLNRMFSGFSDLAKADLATRSGFIPGRRIASSYDGMVYYVVWGIPDGEQGPDRVYYVVDEEERKRKEEKLLAPEPPPGE
ncbi:hypothetical protein HOG48_04815 [Candidatus Peregrinibacteria bacterium]|nr:hypothetical protein [Candidatus Peregrinibacteria bacterium]